MSNSNFADVRHNRAPSLTPTEAVIWGRRQTFHASLSRIAVKDDGIDLKRKPKRPPVPMKNILAMPQNVNDAQTDGNFISKLAADLDLILHPPERVNADIRYSIQEIQSATCRIAKISRAEILSPRRTFPIVRPRQIAMAICKAITTRSFPEIGRRFGNRDHTTVLHAVRKMQPVMDDISDIIDDAPLDYLIIVALDRAVKILPPTKRKPPNRWPSRLR